MRKPRVPLQAASMLLHGLIASASIIPANHLFGREDAAQCPLPGYDRCPQDAENHWPDNFCCETGFQCQTRAGNTTLVCCPPGSACDVISTTSCIIDSYNADTYPDAMVKTTALNGVLPQCGDGTCCPFGFRCVGEDGAYTCRLNDNQNAQPITTAPGKPSSTASSASSTSTTSAKTTTTAQTTTSSHATPTSSSPTTTSTPGQNNGASSGADTSPTLTPEDPNKGASTAVIAGAVIGSAILIAAVAFVAFIFFRRRQNKKQQEEEHPGDTLKLTRSTSSFGNIISNPIVAAGTTMRSDFNRKPPPGARSSTGSGFSTLVDHEMGQNANPKTPSPARMREGVGTTARIPPIRNMAQTKARQSSIAYGVGAPDTSPYSSVGNYHAAESDRDRDRDGGGPQLPYPQTPPRQRGHTDQAREPSSFSIDVFADPRIATPQRNDHNGGGSGGGGLRVPPETPQSPERAMSMMTTFSDMLRSADLGGVAKGEPYVPGSNQGTPASKRR